MCRKIIIILLVCFFNTVLIHAVSAQSPGFVQEDAIKVAGITDPNQIPNLGLDQKQTTRTFVDGLNRPIQIVAIQASANSNKDMIQPVSYDAYGRQTTSYLPYVGADGNGNFHANAIASEQGAFYSNGTSDKVADDVAPYSKQVFENSPLQRLLQAGSVGNGLQPGQHYKSMKYRPNTATDAVIQWGTDGSYQNTYLGNVLSVMDGKDEDGVETLVFKDINGHAVLKRQVANQTINGVVMPYFDTYYLYNNAGMLSYIIPPKALSIMKANSSYLLTQSGVSSLIFKFVYDNLGRLIEKTIPSSGTLYMVYDPLNRLVLMQDANMNAALKWNYIKYDFKGRPVSQGIYTDNTNTTRTAMQTYVNNISSYTTAWYESRAAAAPYYTNTVFPTTNNDASHTALQDLSYSYFDDYDLNGNNAPDYTYTAQGLTGEAIATTQTRGMLTMIRKRTLGTGLSNIWLISVMFYDKHGNVIQTQTNNQLNYINAVTVTDKKTMVPDFLGHPLVTKDVKVTATGTAGTNTVLTTLTYDAHKNNVLTIDQVYNAQSSIRIGTYSYNELGQLVTKQLGKTASSYLQSLDLRYNIRGQLLFINTSTLTSNSSVTLTGSNDMFGMQMFYDHTDSNIGNTAYYNGRLSAVKWMTKDAGGTSSNERSYKYSYDILDRYTGSNYAERVAGGTGVFNVKTTAYDEKGIQYDEGGNILALQRNSYNTTTSAVQPIDNLQYTYDSAKPNQLKSVSDGTGSNYTSAGFYNLTGSTGSYTYDTEGNLTGDPYKGLSIAYNVLNRTDKVTITTATNRYITYTYDSGGTLIRKQQYDNAVLQNTTDYINGFVYVNSTLSYFGMPEGRVRNTGTTLKPEYVINDQQGNARISFEESSTTPGTAVVRQENSYYGFGLVLPNSPVALPTTDNKQLYNGGSEWQKDFGNLPDYYQTFYRNYDAALGRFIGVDPQSESAESLSNYQYANNNPILYNDPKGDRFHSWAGVWQTIYDLMNSPFGGSSSGDEAGDTHEFTSDRDAFYTTSDNIDRGIVGGGYGVAGDFKTAYNNFIRITNAENNTAVRALDPVNVVAGNQGSWNAAIANMQEQAARFWGNSLTLPLAGVSTSDVVDLGAKINAVVGAIAPFIKGTIGYSRSGTYGLGRYYASAWRGGSRALIKTIEVGKVLGVAGFVAGEIMDIINLSNDKISWTHAGVNLFMGIIGFTEAAPIAIGYFAVDAFYDNGWSGVIRDYAHYTGMDKMVQPSTYQNMYGNPNKKYDNF